MTPTLHIRLLGEFQLLLDAQPIHTVDKARLQALLAYLLLHRHAPQARQQIAFHFWPDSSERQAYTNLRKLFFQLRHSLPHAQDFLYADTLSLGWQPSAHFTLDIAQLEQALDELERAEAPDAATVEQVVALYRGELLPTCYEDWLLPLRRALHERVVNTLGRALEGLEAQRAYAVALRSYLMALAAQTYARVGDTQQAQARLDGGLAAARATGEHFWDAELYRLQAEIARTLPSNEQGNHQDETEQCLRQALACARGQAANSPALRAAIDLASLWQTQGKHQAAYDLLAQVYGRFDEGFDTADLKAAAALLSTLAPA